MQVNASRRFECKQSTPSIEVHWLQCLDWVRLDIRCASELAAKAALRISFLAPIVLTKQFQTKHHRISQALLTMNERRIFLSTVLKMEAKFVGGAVRRQEIIP